MVCSVEPEFKMKIFLVIVCFCTAFSIVADEKKIANKVENPKSLNAGTNKVEMTGEQRLLTAFPQLLWSRTKLEFMFENRARIASALAGGANSEDEAFKLAKQMELVFKKEDDRKMFTEGWKMSGKINSKTANFSKLNYALSGIPGEIELLFDQHKLISLSFWADKSDADFAKLYEFLKRVCNSPGQRKINGDDDRRINWVISGSTNRYEVELSHRTWKLSKSVEVERGMTIFIKPPILEIAPNK